MRDTADEVICGVSIAALVSVPLILISAIIVESIIEE